MSRVAGRNAHRYDGWEVSPRDPAGQWGRGEAKRGGRALSQRRTVLALFLTVPIPRSTLTGNGTGEVLARLAGAPGADPDPASITEPRDLRA